MDEYNALEREKEVGKAGRIAYSLRNFDRLTVDKLITTAQIDRHTHQFHLVKLRNESYRF